MKAEIKNINGYKLIEINRKLTNNTLYRSFTPNAENINRFYERGVRLFNVFPSGMISSLGCPYSEFGEFWLGDGKYDFDVLRKQINLFTENAPNAYLSLMLQFDSRDWYIKSHPDAVESFNSISDMACDREWRDCGKRMLSDIIDFINREYPERFYAIFLAAGGTCEWIQRSDPTNLSPLKKKAFKEWKGGSDAELCSYKEATTHSKGLLFDPEKDKNALDFWQFHNETVADAICEFASEAKKLAPNMLTGVFNGYFYYAPAFFGKKCHSEFKRILACKDIDMVFSPASYSFRTPTSVSASQIPVDSVSYSDKLFYHEIDNTTYLSNKHFFAQALQSYAHVKQNTLYETVNYLRREACLMFAKRQSMWWFDMFGCWYDDTLANEIKNIDSIYSLLRQKETKSISEVAFVTDGNSVKYAKISSQFHTENVHLMREAVGRMGTAVDCFESSTLLSDKFDVKKYKLIIFANLIAPSEEIKKKIETLRENGVSFLFISFSGAVSGGVLSFDKMKELTRISVTEKEGVSKYIAFSGEKLAIPTGNFGILQKSINGMCYPTLALSDKDATPIACDLIDRSILRGGIKYRADSSFDAWIAAGPIPPETLTLLAEKAGCKIINRDKIPLYINSRIIGAHSKNGGEHTFEISDDLKSVRELFNNKEYSVNNGKFTVEFSPGETLCFLID